MAPLGGWYIHAELPYHVASRGSAGWVHQVIDVGALMSCRGAFKRVK